MSKKLVSVYGTLKEGWGNHRLLDKAPVSRGYAMVDKLSGVGFPIVKLGDNYKLYVEVYEVDKGELASLDSLEGYTEGCTPTFYDRKTTKVTLDDGSTIDTYIYEYVDDFSNDIESECKFENNMYIWTGGYHN